MAPRRRTCEIPLVAVGAALVVAARASWGCAPAPTPSVPRPGPAPVAAPSSAPSPPLEPLEGQALTFLDTEEVPHTAALAWSPDGQTLAVDEGHQTVGLWLVAGRRRIAVEVPGSVLSLRFSTDGRTLAVVTMRGGAVFEVAGGTCLRFVPATSRREAMRAHVAGGVVATVDLEGRVRAVDVITGELRWEVAADPGVTFATTITADDRLGLRRHGAIEVRSVRTGEVLAMSAPPEEGWVPHVTPDGRSALYVAPDDRAYVLTNVDGTDPRARGTIRGKTVLLSGMAPAGARPAVSTGEPAKIDHVHISPDSTSVVVLHDPPNSYFGLGGKSYDARLIDVATGREQRLPGSVTGVGVFGPRRYLAPARLGTDELVAFDLRSGRRRKSALRSSSPSLATSNPRGDALAVLDGSRLVVVDGTRGGRSSRCRPWAHARHPSAKGRRSWMRRSTRRRGCWRWGATSAETRTGGACWPGGPCAGARCGPDKSCIAQRH